jgi:hypothetical protein
MAALGFNADTIIGVIGTTFFNGSTTLAGLAVMVVIWVMIVAVLANLKAPISYSLVPMIPVAIIFAGMNIISVDVSMIIILVCGVMTAVNIRNMMG